MKFHVKALTMVMLLGTTILSLFLASCGGGSPNTGGSGSSPVSISFWTWNPDVTTLKEEITAFEKQYPNIHVDYKASSYNDYLVNLKAGANAGSLPTVFGMQVGGLQAQYLQYLQPLQGYASAALGANWQSKYVKTGLQQARIVNPTGDTNFYTLPQALGSTSLLVNTTIFQKYHLPVPQTFADLQRDAAVLNSHGVAPMLLGGADGWESEDLFLEIANQTAPNAWYQAQKAGTGFDTPGLEQAMSIWKSLFTDHIVQSGAAGAHAYPNEVNNFNQGQGAIIPLGSWVIQAALPGANNVPLSKYWSMIQFPKINATATQVPLAGVDELLGLNKAASGAQADAGWKLIQFLSQGEGETIYVNGLHDLPAQVGLTTPASLSQASPNAATMYQQSVTWSDEGTLRYVLYPRLDQALITALATVSTGQDTPAAALAKLNGVVNQQQ